MKLYSLPVLILVLGLVSGCLKTRSELKQSGNESGVGSMRTDASGSYVAGNMGQQQRAQIDSRFFEIDRDFRQLYGKIETLERKISELESKPQEADTSGSAAPVDNEKIKSLEKRMSTLEEALLSIDKKLDQLTNDKSASLKKRLEDAKGPFGRGEILYAMGEYEKAISNYNEYRKNFPRGRKYAQATLKMGLCFQRLKMGQDARAFYKEVIQRYPNTRASQAAKSNLQKIKL